MFLIPHCQFAVEPDMVQRGIKDLAVIGEGLPDMLLQQRGLSHALWTFDADDPGLPIDPVVDLALEIEAYLVSIQYVRI